LSYGLDGFVGNKKIGKGVGTGLELNNVSFINKYILVQKSNRVTAKAPKKCQQRGAE
jgi:hypothetical protein